MKIGAGGFVDGLDIVPDGSIVGRTDTNGAYRWTGASWRQLVTATGMPPAFVAANPVTSGQGVHEIKMAPSHSTRVDMMFDGYAGNVYIGYAGGGYAYLPASGTLLDKVERRGR